MSKNAEWLSGESSSSSLPEDIIVEILSWLPVVSLLRFKSVCKKWRDIIERDDEFIEKHHNRTTTCFRYQHKNIVEPTAYSSKYPTKRAVFWCINTQKGLVLEQDRYTRLRIRNPATREAVYLPVLESTYLMLARMFFVAKSCCKVISFSPVGNSGFEGRFRALTVGVDKGWRPLNNYILETIPINVPSGKPEIYALSIEKVFYVFTINSEPKQILWVDVEDERCKSREIPENLFSDWSNVLPREWNSKLSLYSRDGETMNIWVLLQNHEWAKTNIVVDYPVPFVAVNGKIYRERNTSYLFWLRWLLRSEVAVVSVKPSILQLKGMAALPKGEGKAHWKEVDKLIPSSQIISKLSLFP